MINEIRENLNKQDNRATANPIFIVYDYEKVPSQEDYTDKSMFIDEEGFIAKDREELHEWLLDNDCFESLEEYVEELDDDDFLDWLKSKGYDSIDKVWYIKKRVFINVFFTEESANTFIKQNHYNYTKEIHTYVASLYRNPEMQYIRDGIMDGSIIKVNE